jgi:hypothetical protein
MNRAATVALMLLVTSILALSEQPPAIGARFKKKWAAGKEATLCLAEPAQLDPCVTRRFEGIDYQIAYREQTRRVSYLYTTDERFRTADGLKVGDSVPVSQETVMGLPGWQIRAPVTRDRWWPVVGFDLPQIKLNDGTVLDLGNKEKPASGMALILGFAKARP